MDPQLSARRLAPSIAAVLLTAAAACTLLTSASARTAAGANVGWLGFGNTPDELRHSPLTEITKDNVSKLGRLFTVDFRQIDPSIRRGEQSYPVESNGTLYVTTNDDNVFALNATTGAVKWRWQPDNVAVFRNFGIVANRGVALCDGHVFLLTLDMTIVSLDPATGKLERRVPIAKAVPGASSSYGYSETSAPICAQPPSDRRRRRLRVRRARVRDGVPHRSHAGLAEPVLDDPAGRHALAEVRHAGRRRRRLDTDDGRSDDEHALLRHGLCDAALLPVDPARLEPARRLDRRGRPRERAPEVVAAADGAQRVVVRHRAAADGLHRDDRRQEARASSRSRRWKASGSPTTPRPAGRSTSA